MRKHNLEIVLIEANGYCFLNSVLTCLLRDYGDTLTLEDCITKIVTHLCQNHRKYSAFHQTSCSEYATDQLISDALDFFHNGQFFADVVNLLMQITVDALNLELFIYQEMVTWRRFFILSMRNQIELFVSNSHMTIYIPVAIIRMLLFASWNPKRILISYQMLQAKWPKSHQNLRATTSSTWQFLMRTQKSPTQSVTYDKVKDELESSDEELSMHVEDKQGTFHHHMLFQCHHRTNIWAWSGARNQLQWHNRIVHPLRWNICVNWFNRPRTKFIACLNSCLHPRTGAQKPLPQKNFQNT